jgi:NTE family protein
MKTTSALEPGSRILLALGGGSARGIAHIGVIHALEEAGFEIAGIAGTSIGSVIGGVYAAGELDAYEEFMCAIGRRGVLRMLDPVLPRSGLFAGKRLSDLLKSFVGDVCIEELTVPFSAVAVDVSGGDEVRITSGSLVKAMRASFGIPGLFTPFPLQLPGEERVRFLVDGGVASPVPVMAAREFGELPIVAVNVNRGFAEAVIQKKPVEPATGPSRRERLAAFFESERVPRAAREYLRSFFENSNGKSRRPEDQVNGESDVDSRSSFLSRWSGLFGGGEASVKRPGMVDSLYNSVLLLQHHLARSQFLAEPPALLIEPNMEGIGLFEYNLGTLLVEEGARATRESLLALSAR